MGFIKKSASGGGVELLLKTLEQRRSGARQDKALMIELAKMENSSSQAMIANKTKLMGLVQQADQFTMNMAQRVDELKANREAIAQRDRHFDQANKIEALKLNFEMTRLAENMHTQSREMKRQIQKNVDSMTLAGSELNNAKMMLVDRIYGPENMGDGASGPVSKSVLRLPFLRQLKAEFSRKGGKGFFTDAEIARLYVDSFHNNLDEMSPEDAANNAYYSVLAAGVRRLPQGVVTNERLQIAADIWGNADLSPEARATAREELNGMLNIKGDNPIELKFDNSDGHVIGVNDRITNNFLDAGGREHAKFYKQTNDVIGSLEELNVGLLDRSNKIGMRADLMGAQLADTTMSMLDPDGSKGLDLIGATTSPGSNGSEESSSDKSKEKKETKKPVTDPFVDAPDTGVNESITDDVSLFADDSTNWLKDPGSSISIDDNGQLMVTHKNGVSTYKHIIENPSKRVSDYKKEAITNPTGMFSGPNDFNDGSVDLNSPGRDSTIYGTPNPQSMKQRAYNRMMEGASRQAAIDKRNANIEAGKINLDYQGASTRRTGIPFIGQDDQTNNGMENQGLQGPVEQGRSTQPAGPIPDQEMEDYKSPYEPLFEKLSEGESSKDLFNAANNMDFNGNYINPTLNGNLTDMKIEDVMKAQTGYRMGDPESTGAYRKVRAVGRSQFIDTTLAEAVQETGIDPGEKMTPSNQRKLEHYLVTGKRPSIKKYVEGNGNIEKALDDIAKEWRSVEYKDGKGYDGEKPTITRKEMRKVLEALKESYKVSSSIKNVNNF